MSRLNVLVVSGWLVLSPLLAVFGVEMAWGLEVPHLFEVEIRAARQDRAEEKQAVQSAFQQLLARVSDVELVNPPVWLKHAMAQADRYVDRTAYAPLPDQALNYQIYFSEKRLRDLFTSNGFFLWGVRRPQVLVWLAVEEDLRYELLGEEGAGSWGHWVAGLKQAALARRVPLVFPLLDLTDVNVVTGTDVWALNEASLWKAAQRYNAELLLIGKIRKIEGGVVEQWQCDWWLTGKGISKKWETLEPIDLAESGENGGAMPLVNPKQGEGARQLIRELCLELLAYYTTPVSAQAIKEELVVTVQAVSDFKKYQKTASYLQKLPFVTRIDVAQVGSEATSFRLQISQSKETLYKRIKTDGFLTPVLDAQALEGRTYTISHWE